MAGIYLEATVLGAAHGHSQQVRCQHATGAVFRRAGDQKRDILVRRSPPDTYLHRFFYGIGIPVIDHGRKIRQKQLGSVAHRRQLAPVPVCHIIPVAHAVGIGIGATPVDIGGMGRRRKCQNQKDETQLHWLRHATSSFR